MHPKTRAKIESLCADYENVEVLIKQLYMKKDAIQEELGERLGLDNPFEMKDGRIAEYVDNFANKNVIFRPAACRRFELNIRKRKAGEQ